MDNESLEMYLMRFPKTDIYTKFYTKSQEEQKSIVKLGLVMMESGKERKLTLNDEDWELKMLTIKKNYDEKSAIMKKTEKELKNLIDELKEKKKEDLENAVKETADIERNKYENTIMDYKNRLKDKEDSIEIISIKKWEMAEKYRDDYDKKLEEIREKERERTEKREAEYRKTIEDVGNRLNNEDDKCKVASTKGKEGEVTVHQFLVLSLPKSEIIDVSKDGGKGDLIIQDLSMNIMVEVKNYNSCNIKTTEVNKFKKDMINNKSIGGGIFISLHRGICNIDDWTMETVDGRPVIFLTNASKDMEKIAIAYNILKKMTEINIDWTVKEKLKMIEDYVKAHTKQKNKIVKIIEKFSREMVKNIEDDEKKLISFIDSLTT